MVSPALIIHFPSVNFHKRYNCNYWFLGDVSVGDSIGSTNVRRLTSRSDGMPSKKIMESLRTFVFVETVLRRGRMFQGSDEV